MTTTKSDLITLWKYVHKLPAWLTKVSQSTGLDAEDEGVLEDLDGSWMAEMQVLKKRWYKESMAMAANHRDQIIQERPEWVKERRREYLKQEIEKLAARIKEVRTDHAAEKDEVMCLLILSFTDVKGMEKQLGRHKHELRALDNPGVKGRGVTDDQIERAAIFPLENIVEVKKGYVPCLWADHSDPRPSMLYKNGFLHCFKCSTTKSVISYVMKLKNLSFPDAVRAMQ